MRSLGTVNESNVQKEEMQEGVTNTESAAEITTAERRGTLLVSDFAVAITYCLWLLKNNDLKKSSFKKAKKYREKSSIR